MRTALLAAVAVVLVALAPPVPAPADDIDLATAIEQAVDLPDPAARLKAADAIAKRPDATVEALLPILREFGKFDAVPPDLLTEKPSLSDGKTATPTDVLVYVPAGYDPKKPAPLLMAFHGAGGHAEDEWPMWRETADALGMIVVAPQEMGKNEGYEFKEEERQTALSALRWARRKFDVDENRVHATGVSRGGHLTWDLALRHPDLWASASPMIGGPRTANAKGQNNIRFLENVVHLPLRDLQGSKDHPLLLAALRTSFEKLTAFGAADARLIEFPELSHSFEFGAVDWKEFLGGAKRDPRRDHVVRLTVDKDEARSAWAEITALGRGAKEEITLKVDAKEWAAMDEGQQRAAYIAQAEKLTARLVVDRKGPGVYSAIGRYVDRFRILLREEDLPAEGDVVVSFNGREQKHKAKADARVLLRDFVERFDRTFLPVAAVEVR